ncbi:MAG TPA: sensor histidine kinase [Thermoflexales bacterium]|nr:sensor histidine kinase [Thermoflexales bacterium]
MSQSMAPEAASGRAPLATLLRLVQVSLGLRLVLDVVGLISATLAFDAGVIGLVALASLPSLGLLVLTFIAPRRGWVTARFISALLVAILVGQMLEGLVLQAMLRALPVEGFFGGADVLRRGRAAVEAGLPQPLVFLRSGFGVTLLLALIPSMLGSWLGGRRASLRWAALAILLNAAGLVAVDITNLTLLRFNLAAFSAQALVIAVTSIFVGTLADQLRYEQAHLRQANQQLAAQARVGEQLAASRERVRIARDLHDTLAHTLAAIDVQLKAVDALLDADPARARQGLRTAEDVVRHGLRDTRAAITDLRANLVEEQGLAAALQRLVDQIGPRSSASLTFEQIGAEPSLDRGRAETFVRIAQEALTNASRHAQARAIVLRLKATPTEVEIQVSDDGIGFDLESLDDARFGLRGMRERAEEVGARLKIESQAGRGTDVTLRMMLEG